MRSLFRQLLQAQSKLGEAEGMNKNLQDRCREVVQDVVTLKAQLVEKQAVQTENDRLKLQLDSMQSQNLMEQRKAAEERNNLAQLKDAYTKLFEDYNELKEEKKKRESQRVQREVVEQLQGQLTAAEEALVSKQDDLMKQEMSRKEKELETISVFQAQSQLVQRELVEQLQGQLTAAKEALVSKQDKIDLMKQEMSRKEKELETISVFQDQSQLVQRELVEQLQGQLNAAEEALVSKQDKIDLMKQEMSRKEKELETISVFQAQAEVYCSDFYAERAAREKLHEERERLATQLEYVKKQNSHLQEEMESLGRGALNQMQRRHVSLGGSPQGAGASLFGRGTDWQHQGNIPEHACPKCNEILPDLDSLQIHIMDCIN